MHDEFQPEHTNDGRVVPQDDFGLWLDDPEGSSEESGPYRDEDAGLEDTGTSVNPEATDGEPAAAQPGAGAV